MAPSSHPTGGDPQGHNGTYKYALRL
ncbi:MAG: hypothetical protein UV57_C0044G0001, partial [Parcubacteria group bacterium GW2011_GWD2_43_10]